MITKRRKQCVRAILLDDFLDLVQSIKQDVVDLTSSNGNVFDKGFCGHYQVVKLLLCLQNLVLVLAGDYDFVPRSNEGAGRTVAEYIRE